MKNLYVALVFVFGLQFSFGQIGFEENVITGPSNSVASPYSVFTADLDGDGDMDLLSASADDDKIAWYENIDGQGNFSSQKIITTNADSARSVFAVDIDNDGDVDVLSASLSDDKIAWYENTDGLGSFGSQQIISTNANFAISVFAADLDSDGDIDVLSASREDDKIAWYENIDGQGTFGSQQIISLNANGAESVYAIDIDNDGDIDVISSSVYDDKIAWYENIDGLGSFSSENIISTTINGARIISADLDGDNDNDVVFASEFDDTVGWFENLDGLGDFGTQQNIATNIDGAKSVFAIDIDNDGDIDVLSSSETENKIVLYKNTNGLGNFGGEQVITDQANEAQFVFAEDLDNDNDNDVISVSREDDKIAWYKNLDGEGSFSQQVLIVSNISGPWSMQSVDIDGDGDIDVISSSYGDGKIAWFENLNGLGEFSAQNVVAIVSAPVGFGSAGSVFSADLDSDGDMDIFCSINADNKIVWYENTNGQGEFSTEQIISNSVQNPGAIIGVDIDLDGDIDVVLASSFNIAWYENIDGQGTFGTEQIIATDVNGPTSIKAKDLDGDGDFDVLASSYGDSKIIWYENISGQGDFGSQQIITTNAISPESVFAEDIDGDGDFDVLSASRNDDKIAWYENTDGLGDFGPEQIITTNADEASSVYAEDIDNDGDKDVVSASRNDDKIAWYENTDGLGSFGSEQIISFNAEGAKVVNLNDIDNDGDIDVISASTFDDKIAWFKNLGVLGNEINGTVTYNYGSANFSISNVLVNATNISDSFSTFSQQDGTYQIAVNQGDFTSVVLNLPSYMSFTPASQQSFFAEIGDTDTIDFSVGQLIEVNDLNIAIYPAINEPRPGFDTTHQLVYNNVGTTQLSGSISFEFDDSKLQFLTSSETITSQSASTLNFDFTDLNPFETRIIDLDFNVFAPPTTSINDILMSTATINPLSGDETEDDNTFTIEQTVIGSYDPNDIQCLEGEQILLEDADKYLHYLIRFQNTGTASAINVRVENSLDNKLDWTTMQLETMSHEGRVEILNGSEVSFVFNNINLPDSNNDEPNSHGFIAYKIKPNADVVLGDIFYNTADIYFDFNPPIITNTATTEIVETLSLTNVNTHSFNVFPNPAQSDLTVKGNRSINHVTIVDVNGRLLKSIKRSGLTSSTIINVEDLNSGIYFLNIESESTKQVVKFVKN
ncbi:T9SS type A sorting domain-containing protein [Sediminibacter sp. Hel_I_10]|uniref:T9SS type A sorting domain-containing protein n=1 Tax=Sediminibacter sp. Hel_I_10 TaxID=1392490 RepID=UPI00047DCDBB|nr:FG-GAP-like repeat-containing protein [Sediminibacter sp. Hel_I_10]